MNKLILTISVAALASLGTTQGMGRGPMGGGMGPGHMEDMQTIHQLMGDHDKVKRKVEKTKTGVVTVTESSDKEVARLIKAHAAAMQKRIKSGSPIRMWDPLFAELFANHDKISMKVENTKNGVRVTESAQDPYVVTLIQWHAEGVNGFVREGMAGMHKEHPAPPKPGSKAKPADFIGMGDGVTTCPVTGEPISKEVSADIQGKTVYFCCPGCIEKVRKDPKRYLKWAK